MPIEDELDGLLSKICFIMQVDKEEVKFSLRDKNTLARSIFIYYAHKHIGATRKQIQKVIPITLRNISKRIACIRDGVKRDPYYREPYELIEKGLTE